MLCLCQPLVLPLTLLSPLLHLVCLFILVFGYRYSGYIILQNIYNNRFLYIFVYTNSIFPMISLSSGCLLLRDVRFCSGFCPPWFPCAPLGGGGFQFLIFSVFPSSFVFRGGGL